jgi:hypothetical protein
MGGIASAIGSFLGAGGGGAQAQLVEQPELVKQIQQAQTGFGGLSEQQQALAQALLAQTRGEGPAAQVVQRAQERAAMQGAGMLAGARGINPALAARMAAQQAAAGQQAAVGGAGELALQSQAALGGLYGQMGQQSLSQLQMLQQALAAQNQARLGNLEIQEAGRRAQAQLGGQLLGGAIGGASAALTGGMMKKNQGGFIDGKAKVDGDSPVNDVVPALLSPGEIVVPRSAAKNEESAKAFIESLMAREGKKKKTKKQV